MDEYGVHLRSDLKPIGNIMPDWISGITNTFRYKNIILSALIDARVGADLLS